MDATLILPDGRKVSVWEGGSPGGVPIVFHHGTPSGRLQAALGADAAVRQNVRIVSFNRPGYGESTDTAPGLASVGADTMLVADALGISEFAVLGASGGGPYALATGLADPGRVRAVGVAGGVGPWRLITPPDPDDPDLPILALVDAGDVPGALAGFRAQARVAFERMLALPDEAMVDEFFRDAPTEDLSWLDQGARRLWAADARDALHTYDGYARDNVSWGGPWDIDPARIEVPTWLWYGELDRMVPPEHGRWHAERIPNSTLTIIPAAGHGGTIFAQWDDMLGVLRAAVR
ncbi:alpha/beta fold hydrolase [Kribbella pittospori]|uniref:alpha/beta fold hydrolase n=1 Tax=Kribbella pittospori TaxID=722689 RepID=UPI0013F44E24|nr:alpha/beta hydrolase [Kribbella pittospori]